MTSLHDRNDIASGDPDEIRGQARELRTVCANIDTVVDLLRQVTTNGVWDSGAGRTFADQVGETPDDLDDVSARLHDTAGVLEPYADLLEDSQRRLSDLDDQHADARRTRQDRDKTLEALPAEDPERARLERERGEAATRAHDAQEDFEDESDEALGDEKRTAAKLHEVCVELTDPRGYDAWEGLTNTGQDASSSPLGIVARPVAAAGVAEPIGMAGRRIFYDEGSWRAVGKKSAWYAADTVTLGAGRAIGWAKRTAKGAPPPKSTTPNGRFPSQPRSAVTNPIAGRRLHDISSARTPVGTWAQGVKHDAAEKLTASVRRKTGIADIEQFAGDWRAVSGSRTRQGVIVSAHATKQGHRVAKQVDSGVEKAEKLGLSDPEERSEGGGQGSEGRRQRGEGSGQRMVP